MDDVWKSLLIGAVLGAVSAILVYSFADHFWYLVLELMTFGFISFFIVHRIIQDSKGKTVIIQALEKRMEFQAFQNELLLDEDRSWKKKFDELQEYHENKERATREFEEKREASIAEAEKNLMRRIAEFEAIQGQKNTEQQERFAKLERGLQGFL